MRDPEPEQQRGHALSVGAQLWRPLRLVVRSPSRHEAAPTQISDLPLALLQIGHLSVSWGGHTCRAQAKDAGFYKSPALSSEVVRVHAGSPVSPWLWFVSPGSRVSLLCLLHIQPSPHLPASPPTTRHTGATAFRLRPHSSHSDDRVLPATRPSLPVTLRSSDFLTKPTLIPRPFSSCPFNSISGQESPTALGPGGGSHLVLSWGDLNVPNAAGPWPPDSAMLSTQSLTPAPSNPGGT